MRKSTWIIACVALFLLVMTAGCAQPLDETGGREVNASLSLSLKSAGTLNAQTKMLSTTTQSSGNAFRGIDHIYIVPFRLEDNTAPLTAAEQRHGDVMIYTGFNRDGLIDNNNAHLYSLTLMPWRMNHVLVYGKSIDNGGVSTKELKHRNGILNPTNLTSPPTAGDVNFQLEQILSTEESTEIETKATALINALNGVINVFRTCGDARLEGFIPAISREDQILACSFSTFYKIREDIFSLLRTISGMSADVSNSVASALGVLQDALDNAGNDFPSAYGIPEGCIGFWWNGQQFVRLINGVNIALVSPRSYTYPPSLWYTANSVITTSNEDDQSSQYKPSNTTWGAILSHYTDGDEIQMTTRAVAVVNQLQYGVALLKLEVLASSAVSAAFGCPLTGVIVGEQREVVDFNFQPKSGEIRYVYDNVFDSDANLLLTNEAEKKIAVSTLVLPTLKGQTVHFALEFENNTGQTLYCEQGDILPWCKFYFAGVLEVPETDAVFVSDCYTTVSATAVSLKKAYNTVPDLRDPALEIGILTRMDWEQVSPESVKINI